MKKIPNKPAPGPGDDEYWVSPLEKIIGVVDDAQKLVQIYEFHARGTCRGASAWVAYHYPRTSPIVKSAVTDGARNIFTLKLGTGKLDLKPSISPAGIESAELCDDELAITYAGLAGGGVGISKCRAHAKNVKNIKVIKAGGGSKLGRAVFILPVMHKIHVGIDDTDTSESGATWSLANEIGYSASKIRGVEYLNHTIVQLYPKAPGKTKNCVSTAINFGVRPASKAKLIKFIEDQLKSQTFSDDTGMAVMEGIKIHRNLKSYSDQCRKGIVSINTTEKVAGSLDIRLVEITGRNGLIGALAALGYSEAHNKAVQLK